MILFQLQCTCCTKSKQSLRVKMWEEHTFLHSNVPRTHCARKSPLPRPNTLPTQYIFRTEPCLQSTVHQTTFYSCFLLPLGKHRLMCFLFQCTVRRAESGVAGADGFQCRASSVSFLICWLIKGRFSSS